MASGDLVGVIFDVSAPTTSFATREYRVGGSSPAEAHPLWNFPDAAAAYLDFHCRTHGYSGNGTATGLTVIIAWLADTVTANNVVWQAAIRRIGDDIEDIDAAHTYLFNTVTDGAPGVNGELSYATITFTDGADMDDLDEAEEFILRIYRDPTNASDTLADDALLRSVLVFET